jgi:hypothetical protein
MGQGKHLLRKIQITWDPADRAPVRRLGPLRAARPDPGGARRESGAALVEFALVLPVFLMLLLGMMTGGLAYSRKLSIAQAAREGARFGATLPITASLPVDPWLARVGALTINSSDGELASNKPGRYVCIAHVPASGAARRWEVTGSAAPVPSAGTCIADDGRAGETRVQVVAQRTSRLEALVFSRDLTLASHAVARFES